MASRTDLVVGAKAPDRATSRRPARCLGR